MTSSLRQRRLPTSTVCRIALAVCASAALAGDVAADTFQSALYRFDIPATEAAAREQSADDSGVYLRVSNADGIVSDPARPFCTLPAPVESGTVLFEFFVAGDAPELTIERVRFHDLTAPGGLLENLCAAFRTDQDNDIAWQPSLPRQICVERGDGGGCEITFDLRSRSDPAGLSAGQVVGLMFELAPGETVETLIDRRLARADLRPEIEVRGITGEAVVWALAPRRIASGRDVPRPSNGTLANATAPAATSVVPRGPVAIGGWVAFFPDDVDEPFADSFTRKVLSVVPRGVRAREPPNALRDRLYLVS